MQVKIQSGTAAWLGWLKGPARPTSASPEGPQDSLVLQPSLQGPNGQPIRIPADGTSLSVGREGCVIGLKHPDASRRHAELRHNVDKNCLEVRDFSSNGTFINGKRLAKDRWSEVPRGAELTFGTPAETFGYDRQDLGKRWTETLPDGYQAIVERQQDGKLKVSTVILELSKDEYALKQFQPWKKTLWTTVFGPRPGTGVYGKINDRMWTGEFLGRDQQGQILLGQSQTFSPEEFTELKRSERAQLISQAEYSLETARQREAQAQNLKQQLRQQLALSDEELQRDPQGSASRILASGSALAHDGLDLWPKAVSQAAESLLRSQLAADPQAARLGLVEFRTQKALAGLRGEFLLYRGLPGERKEESVGWYTDDVMGATGYAQGRPGDRPGTVVGLRVPRSQLLDFCQPGGTVIHSPNPFAEAYYIEHSRLDNQAQPVVLLQGKTPGQAWVFDKAGENSAQPDRLAHHQDFQKLLNG